MKDVKVLNELVKSGAVKESGAFKTSFSYLCYELSVSDCTRRGYEVYSAEQDGPVSCFVNTIVNLEFPRGKYFLEKLKVSNCPLKHALYAEYVDVL